MTTATKDIKKIANSAADSNRLWVPQNEYSLAPNSSEYKDDDCYFVPKGNSELASTSGALSRR